MSSGNVVAKALTAQLEAVKLLFLCRGTEVAWGRCRGGGTRSFWRGRRRIDAVARPNLCASDRAN